MGLSNLTTPSLILDRTILTSNLNAMTEKMAKHRVGLRPHLKTAKSIQIAKLATSKETPIQITVSTLKEARYFFEHNIMDITYAVVILPGKLDEAASMIREGALLTIIVDNVSSAIAIADYAHIHNIVFRVLIEVDTGDKRSGVLSESMDLIQISKLLDNAKNIELKGVLTHAGHSYNCRTIPEIEVVAEEERIGITNAAKRLRTEGMPVSVVSAGSTPTAVHAQSLEGITEMRPGVYMFNDLQQLALGACTRNQLALSVLASVIGHSYQHGHLLLDAGGLALSKDNHTNDESNNNSYGEVCDLDLQPVRKMQVTKVSQEHGQVPLYNSDMLEIFPIGSKVRIVPNHACFTAAAHGHYNVIENGNVVDKWNRINGW